MKIKVPQDISNIQDFENFRRYCSVAVNQLVDVVNGNIDFVDNCGTSLVSVNFTAANAEVRVSHRLGRIPNGWIVVSPTASMQVYKGTNADTETDVYVKSSAIGSCSLLIF